MAMQLRTFLMAGAVVMALHAEAAVTVTPASPSSQDAINVTIDEVGLCLYIVTTSINGSSIRTDILQQGCFEAGAPPPTVQAFDRFGPLAAGTYTYDVYVNYEHTGPVLQSHQTIVVVPAVPSLTEVGLAMLAVSLAAIACLLLRRVPIL